VVKVGGAGAPTASGSAAYLEQHLVNIKSDPWIALAFLVPLLIALILPVPFLLWRRQPAPALADIPAATPGVCPRCAQPLRPGAKFCARCGAPIATATPAPQASACPHCHAPMRPNANFCPVCGRRR